MVNTTVRPRRRLKVSRNHGAHFWGLCLQLGRQAVVRVPKKSELFITRACSTVTHNVKLVLSGMAISGSERHVTHFSVPLEGVALPIRLYGGTSLTWKLRVQLSNERSTAQRTDGAIDLLGFVRRRQPHPVIRRRLGQHFIPTSVQQSSASAALASELRERPRGAEMVEVPVPPGWAGLSFRAAAVGDDERLVVTEVPKACFSSAAFGASASRQVSGVREGDEIWFVNGERPTKFASRIASSGDALNACATASPPHAPGAVGKLDSSPCVSCDFVRRWKQLGLDVALQLWIRAVKREMPISLTIRPGSGTTVAGPSVSVATNSATASKSSVVVSSAGQTFGRYNPLRPAAALAAAGSLDSVRKKPVEPMAKASPCPKRQIAGFICEDRAVGMGGQVANQGQKVVFKFQLRLAKSEKKVLERGEVECRLGDAEVLDGWVDGNVDMEQVLADWGRSIVGMHVGGTRRVSIPAKRGFRDGGGGDVVPSGANLLFDVELKKLL